MKSLSETKWTMSVDLSKLNRSAQDKKESSFLKKKTTAKNIIVLQLSEDCDVERNSCFPWHLTLPFYTIDSNFTSGFIWRQTRTPTTGGIVLWNSKSRNYVKNDQIDKERNTSLRFLCCFHSTFNQAIKSLHDTINEKQHEVFSIIEIGQVLAWKNLTTEVIFMLHELQNLVNFGFIRPNNNV